MSVIKIVLPAYNEEAEIEDLLRSTHSLFQGVEGDQMQFIVVDDGSQDGTVAVVKELAVTLPIQLIEHTHNRGLGAAICTGLTEAILHSKPDDIIVTTEADGTQAADCLVPLVHAIREGSDAAIATPLTGGGFVGVPFYRRCLSRGGNLIYRLLFPIPGLHDYTNLVRAFKADLLQRGYAYYGSKRFMERAGFESVPDLLIKLRKFQPHITEVPITIDNTTKQNPSSMNLIRTISASLSLCAHHLFQSR